MFLEIDELLTRDEVEKLRAIAAAAPFVAGRVSNPHNITKNNFQIDINSPAYQESSALLMNAYMRNEQFRLFALPKVMAPPMICKYQQGMSYGRHSDSAYEVINGRRQRFDVSSTVFLGDPTNSLGGELTIHLGSQPIRIKGKPGSAVIYPSSTIHEVLPLEQGERLVAITFIESEVRDPVRRGLLYDLNEVYALEGETMEWENRIRLQHVHTCLKRMWAE
ncbi:MAG: Fe2+-dependent dioxygenase [Parvularculaceae bacterium]|nr:Fe2+-dependent dioxygenase [Parvularculaceae bacterium]